MVASHTALGRALLLSLLLHAIALAASSRWLPLPRDVRSSAAALSVWLRKALPPEALVLPSAPPLSASAPPVVRRAKPNATAERPRLTRAAPAPQGMTVVPRFTGEAARAAHVQLARGLLYPLEAIERGLEGEATVLVFLDASGNVIASRLESSSGYALLDDAALAAARGLRGLPDSAPREALLPVRFRLAQ
jgi:protein TonB